MCNNFLISFTTQVNYHQFTDEQRHRYNFKKCLVPSRKRVPSIESLRGIYNTFRFIGSAKEDAPGVRRYYVVTLITTSSRYSRYALTYRGHITEQQSLPPEYPRVQKEEVSLSIEVPLSNMGSLILQKIRPECYEMQKKQHCNFRKITVVVHGYI